MIHAATELTVVGSTKITVATPLQASVNPQIGQNAVVVTRDNGNISDWI